MNVYPFPDKVSAQNELSKDIQRDKVPEKDRECISNRAWETGVEMAYAVLKQYPGKDIYQIASLEGIQVERRDVDKVSGGARYFAEYYAGRKTVFLYSQSIRQWAEANQLSQHEAEELILAHELFHHYECTRIGKTSEQYQVPRIQLGAIKLGKTGILALSEIGAYGFSYTWFYEKDTNLSESNDS